VQESQRDWLQQGPGFNRGSIRGPACMTRLDLSTVRDEDSCAEVKVFLQHPGEQIEVRYINDCEAYCSEVESPFARLPEYLLNNEELQVS